MEARSLLRPMANLLSRPSCTSRLSLTATRGHKTTARTKRSLKMAPHSSFLPDRSVPQPAADTIIYNPPSSEATPYHTPYLFLPESDPRRAALRRVRSVSTLASKQESTLPPETKTRSRPSEVIMTEDDVREMKRLRAEDPLTWNVNSLSKKFKCSPVFVQIAAPASREHHGWLQEKERKKMARWGPMRTKAREDRARRREMLYRGEL